MFRTYTNVVLISHLFAEADVNQASVLQNCLTRFCRASGQKVSLAKSRVFFSANVPHGCQSAICSKLGIEGTSDLGLYLGMPTLTSRVTRDTFSHLCEKIDRRLAGWKTKYLSLAGRITLAKSSLSTLACYSMQTAKIPKTVCDDIDKRVCRFVWGGNEDKRSIHLLSWEKLQDPILQGGLGIPSARQANAAFLTKLGWRMLTEPNSLWARVLRYKYCQGRCDVDMFQAKNGMSNVWSGITENARVLCEGMRVAVGNGAQTRFWDHRWATDTPLRELTTQPIPLEISNATVEEMWEDGYGWKWDIFSPYLNVATLSMIQSHGLRSNPDVGDLLYWGNSSKGKFKIKSAIQIIRRESRDLDTKVWGLVWGAPVQQRVRAFLWLCCHDRIMSNYNRFKRRLVDDPKCFICGARAETTLHLLRDCPAARCVWRKVGVLSEHPHFFLGDIQHWVISNLDLHLDNMDENWNTHFCVTVWWIWKWRNNFVFGRTSEIPTDPGIFLQERFKETRKGLSCGEFMASSSSYSRQEVFISWQAPPVNWVVLNTDGAAKGVPGPAGGGGLFRDNRGFLVSAFIANFGHCTAFKAEALALLQGLEMARELHIKKLVVQLDNQACVQAIIGDVEGSGECTHIINACRRLVRDSSWDIRVSHIFREGNRAADWLANYGVAQPLRFFVLEDIPLSFSRILEEDCRGVALPRFIPP